MNRILGSVWALLVVSSIHAKDTTGFGKPFLEKHCFSCHDAESKKGGLDLTSLHFDMADDTVFSSWIKIHDKIHDGEMPPGRRGERMDANERRLFIAELSKQLIEVDLAHQKKQGRGVIRRLNRVEFETALSGLLGVPVRIAVASLAKLNVY